jgi:oxygen-independent coproporphyrinogen-3 oxidase
MIQKSPGLYIHIPFCRSKCLYCNFFSVTSLSGKPGFLEALFTEMEMYRDAFARFDTLYIGGGTPSVLDIKEMEALVANIRQCFTIAGDAEITVEVNPADIEFRHLKFMKNLGINRLNIGVQSLDENILIFLGRRHSPEQGKSAIEDARRAGFDNIGIDLVYGVPGQSMESWLSTLQTILSTGVEHLSCYQLTLETGTVLKNRYDAGEFTMPDEALQIDFFLNTSEALEAAGYIHYEVSNFSKGMEHASRHNQKYWDQTPYLGLGPSAHSFQNNKRWWNLASVNGYIQHIKDGSMPIDGCETLTPEELCFEGLFLGLRTKQGINMEDFSKKHPTHKWEGKREILAKLDGEGLIEIKDGFVIPTRRGLAVADSLALM